MLNCSLNASPCLSLLKHPRKTPPSPHSLHLTILSCGYQTGEGVHVCCASCFVCVYVYVYVCECAVKQGVLGGGMWGLEGGGAEVGCLCVGGLSMSVFVWWGVFPGA